MCVLKKECVLKERGSDCICAFLYACGAEDDCKREDRDHALRQRRQ